MMKEYSFSERHMGTDVSVSLVLNSQTTAQKIATKIFAEINSYEQHFSRFLPNSTLCKLNQAGTLIVDTEFIAVLEKSLTLSQLTANAFNPLNQVSRLGYRQSLSQLKNKSQNTDTSPYNTDINLIKIDRDEQQVILNKDQRLDFGGILKGYLAHKLANEIMHNHSECLGLIINIGGDLTTRGCDEIHEPFIFLLYNPVTATETAVPIINQSLATSGTYARTWLSDTGLKNHIVDTRSKDNPQTSLVSASIIHRDGSTAEALTKLFLIHDVAEASRIWPPDDYHFWVVTKSGDVYTNL